MESCFYVPNVQLKLQTQFSKTTSNLIVIAGKNFINLRKGFLKMTDSAMLSFYNLSFIRNQNFFSNNFKKNFVTFEN